MKKRIYLIGMAAAVVYVFSVILGGVLWDGYSHLSQAISEFTMVRSPILTTMDRLFSTYGLLLFLFGLGWYSIWVEEKNKWLKASAAMLIVCSLAGLLMKFAPMDPIGHSLTTRGTVHLVLAGVASLSTILAVFFAAYGFKETKYAAKLSNFSYTIACLIVIFGALAAIAPKLLPSYLGLTERLTIGSFIIWLFWITFKLFFITPKEVSDQMPAKVK